jgi:uncharacterized membrane protein required for colicin V production
MKIRLNISQDDITFALQEQKYDEALSVWRRGWTVLIILVWQGVTFRQFVLLTFRIVNFLCLRFDRFDGFCLGFLRPRFLYCNIDTEKFFSFLINGTYNFLSKNINSLEPTHVPK